MKLLMLVSLLFASVIAWGETPFTIEKFHASQEAGDKILLHFHADWCPTCKTQKKILSQLEPSGVLKPITVYTVDYDKETEFKKEMKVTAQSTFISFFGKIATNVPRLNAVACFVLISVNVSKIST